MTREKLLLLPGMMCDERLFAPQIFAFEKSHEVLVPKLTGSDSITSMAEDVLRQAGDELLNVAGLSMGGIVAMAMVQIAPNAIARLALLDTNHLADPPERREIRNRQIADVRAGRLRQVIAREMKPNYLAAANRGRRDLLDLLIDMAMELGPDVFVDQSVALRDRPSHEEALAAFNGPALVLHGSEDQLCTPQRHREIAALFSNGVLVEIPGAGHISTLEQPDIVNAALSEWLGRPA
jgi:pimeloyl-ACP methyl ester carboxylesterase